MSEEYEKELGGELTLVQAISKSELDQQIATAHAFPRSLTKFRRDALEMATMDEQTAQECIYALPRKEDGQTKMITGPSARLAEIIVSSWGNCRAGARIIEEGREFVTAQGVFHDLERNSAITYEVKRRITGRNGNRYSADMIGVTANAACSIALRNAVFKGVPKALWAGIESEVRRVIAGDAKTLGARRDKTLGLLNKMGVPNEKIFAVLNVTGSADIGLEEIVTLTGLGNAIKEGEMSIEEAFAPKGEPLQGTTTAERAKEALRRTAATPTPEPLKTPAAQPTPAAPKTAQAAPTPEPTPKAQPEPAKPAQVATEAVEAEEDQLSPAVLERNSLARIAAATSKKDLLKGWDSLLDAYLFAEVEIPRVVEDAFNKRRQELR